jgi:hypothetical protein
MKEHYYQHSQIKSRKFQTARKTSFEATKISVFDDSDDDDDDEDGGGDERNKLISNI